MSKKNPNYIVVIGDLVNSKVIPARPELQERLKSGFVEISKPPAVTSPYTITLGDEFQAVFHSGEGLFKSIFAIRALLHPVDCRFAVGIGTLSTAINPVQAIGMDGPAFHKARKAIELLKANKELLAITGLSRPMKALVDPLIKLLWRSTRNWNANRLEVLIGLIEGQTERELAYKLDLSERAIYKTIKDGQLHDWVKLIREVEMRMTQVLDI